MNKEKNKAKRILLLVHSMADWAIDFYLKIGFKIVGKSQDEAVAFQEEIKSYYIKDTLLMAYEL